MRFGPAAPNGGDKAEHRQREDAGKHQVRLKERPIEMMGGMDAARESSCHTSIDLQNCADKDKNGKQIRPGAKTLHTGVPKLFRPYRGE